MNLYLVQVLGSLTSQTEVKDDEGHSTEARLGRGSDAGAAGQAAALAGRGGVLGALASSACCILPVVLLSLGASGAWLGNLSALSPYQPIFVALTLAFLASGFWLAYRRPKAACAGSEACAQPTSGRTVKAALWAATLLVATAIAFPYLAPALLGV